MIISSFSRILRLKMRHYLQIVLAVACNLVCRDVDIILLRKSHIAGVNSQAKPFPVSFNIKRFYNGLQHGYLL